MLIDRAPLFLCLMYQLASYLFQWEEAHGKNSSCWNRPVHYALVDNQSREQPGWNWLLSQRIAVEEKPYTAIVREIAELEAVNEAASIPKAISGWLSGWSSNAVCWRGWRIGASAPLGMD